MDNSISRHILNLCNALFYIALTFLIVIAAIGMWRLSDAGISYIESTQKMQCELKQQAEATAELISECALYAVTLPLQAEGLMSPYDASQLQNDAITSIKKRSERWGKVAESLHSTIQKQQQMQRHSY